MSDLKDILNPEEYNEIGKKLEYRIAKIEEKEREKQRLETEIKDKRKTIMDYLHSIHSDGLCQKYLKLVGRFPVYKFRTGNLYFKSDGIYIKDFPFNEGHFSKKIECGMGGYDFIQYKIEDMVKNIEDFKRTVSENVHKEFKNAKI